LRRSTGSADRLSLLAILAVVSASVAYLLYLGRRTSFFYDEWTWIVGRRGWAPPNFLLSHNGHFVALPVLVYHLLFALVGLHAYLPYRLVLMATHAVLCLLLYYYARPRVGPWLAVVAGGSLCLIGPAYQDLVWPFQISFIGALLFGLAALLALDRAGEAGRDRWALVFLLAAIACSGAGLAMLAGAGVRIIGRRQWRRWWIVAIPAAGFGLWYLGYGGLPPHNSDLGQRLGYAVKEFRAGIGGLTGHPATSAVGLAAGGSVLVLALVLARLALALSRRRLPVELLSTITVAAALLGLTAIARTGYHDFGASRYLYSTGFAIILVLADTLAGVRWRGPLSLGLGLAVALAVWTGLPVLRANTVALSNVDTYVRADLAAVDQLKSPPRRYLINRRVVPSLTIGQYLSIRSDLGSPAMPFSAITRQSPGVRDDVDRILRQAGGLTLSTVRAPGARLDPLPVPDRLVRLSLPPGCRRVSGPAGVEVVLVLPAGGITMRGSRSQIVILVNRFGPTRARLAALSQGGWHHLTGSADSSPVPWTTEILSADQVDICRTA